MTLQILLALCLLCGLMLLLVGIRGLSKRRVAAGALCGLLALALILGAAVVALLAAELRTYQRLSFEQRAAQLQFSRLADRQYRVLLTYPSGASETFFLRGDEWQMDARLIKWHPLAIVIGFDTVYRLERLSGRYATIADERLMPRTVYALNPPQTIDVWELARRYPAPNSWARRPIWQRRLCTHGRRRPL